MDKHRCNAPAASEMACIMPGEVSEAVRCNRDIVVYVKTGGVFRMSELNPAYDPLHFTLLFPNGDLGWHPAMVLENPKASRSRYAQLH